MIYSQVLLDSINREKKLEIFKRNDRLLLEKMFDEINIQKDTDFHFLAEIDAYNISGSGSIMAKYLDEFQSETIRCYLIPQMVADKIEDCGNLVLRSYLHFKNSDEYISAANVPSPAHIYVRYDNAFKKLKPKELKANLSELAQNPRDAFYLPLTMRMLASWRIPELEQLFLTYLKESNITNESVGLTDQDGNYYPPISFIRRELKFTAIECLKYYPSVKVLEALKDCANNIDEDVSFAVNKSLRFINKNSI